MFRFLFCRKFQGYAYPKPPTRVLPKPAENVTQQSGPPPGVQGDFIDDLISEHKQQILMSVLGGSAAQSSPFVGGGDGKAIAINKCASCSKYEIYLIGKMPYFLENKLRSNIQKYISANPC